MTWDIQTQLIGSMLEANLDLQRWIPVCIQHDSTPNPTCSVVRIPSVYIYVYAYILFLYPFRRTKKKKKTQFEKIGRPT